MRTSRESRVEQEADGSWARSRGAGETERRSTAHSRRTLLSESEPRRPRTIPGDKYFQASGQARVRLCLSGPCVLRSQAVKDECGNQFGDVRGGARRRKQYSNAPALVVDSGFVPGDDSPAAEAPETMAADVEQHQVR